MANCEWFYTRDGRNKFGPLSLPEMLALLKSGKMLPTDMVRRGDAPKWSAAASKPELFPAPQCHAATPTDHKAAISNQPPRSQGSQSASRIKPVGPDPKQKATTTPQLKRRLMIGLATSFVGLASAGVLLLCLLVGLWWFIASRAGAPKTADAEGKLTPPPPKAEEQQRPRQTLQQLFVRLAPAVPIVEAVESGSGSGFLVKQDGKYLIVTNRHVVENARQGVAIHFLLGDGPGDEKRFTIPGSKTSIIAIHRTADLAIVDVSSAGAEIDGLHIEPIHLAPPGHKPQVGEHVFAIGHPGGGTELLTRTLSDGIVSAVGRKYQECNFLQVTVPINPGNSGGPLFNDEGRVVGVNTFTLRKSAGRDFTLEALNFALDGEFIQELLTDKAKSLDNEAIAALVKPPDVERPQTLTEAQDVKVRRFTNDGYSPFSGTVSRTMRAFPLEAERRRVFTIRCEAGKAYALSTVSKGADDIKLAVLDSDGKVIATAVRVNPDPDLAFRVPETGTYSVVVLNPSDADALVILTVWEK